MYSFQPYEYNNLKLIYYVYLMAGLFAGFLAVQAYRASRWSIALLLPAALVAIPGLLSITHEFQMRYQFADSADVALAGWVRANTAPDAVFIGTDRPNEPVATLGGRTLVMGYRGWLLTYSVPYADREAAVSAALQGRVNDPMLRMFGPDYLAVGSNEDKSWTVDRTSLAGLPVAYHNAEWTIYRLTGAGTSWGAKARKPARRAADSRPPKVTGRSGMWRLPRPLQRPKVIFYMLEHVKCTDYIIGLVTEW